MCLLVYNKSLLCRLNNFSYFVGFKRLKGSTIEGIDGEFSYFAVFNGHGGSGAARYTQKNLWSNVRSALKFCSNDKRNIMKAIIVGFCNTQEDMLSKRHIVGSEI